MGREDLLFSAFTYILRNCSFWFPLGPGTQKGIGSHAVTLVGDLQLLVPVMLSEVSDSRPFSRS